jgi:hypothetical protein
VEWFSREHLLRLLTRAPNAEWRLDCDVSLDAAARMARFMADTTRTRGTFYVRVTGETYNPFSDHSRLCLLQIMRGGHRFGLHADVRGYPPEDGWIERAVATQADLLAFGLPGILRADGPVSFHQPDPTLLWRDFDAFASAYCSRWEGRYVSDSAREWDEGKELMACDGHQVCLHPEHWLTEDDAAAATIGRRE